MESCLSKNWENIFDFQYKVAIEQCAAILQEIKDLMTKLVTIGKTILMAQLVKGQSMNAEDVCRNPTKTHNFFHVFLTIPQQNGNKFKYPIFLLTVIYKTKA